MYIVYLVTDTGYLAGGMRVIFEHVNRLSALGHKVEVWQREKGAQPYFKSDVPVKHIDAQDLSTPDILVLTDLIFMDNALTAKRKRGTTYFLMQHDFEWLAEATGEGKYGSWFAQHENSYRSGNVRILVVSSWLQSTMRTRHNIETYLVRNGVDTSIFYPKEPYIKQPKPLALLIYDPQAWKGFEETVNALLSLKELDIKVAMVGRSYPLTPYNDGQYYGFSFPSLFFCRPNQGELASIYSSASLFISASWKEGFGLPGLEAMACGVPLLTTDSGGPSDYAIANETAIVVPAQDINAMQDGIRKLLEDDKLKEKLTQNGLEKVKEFEWESSMQELETLFMQK
jgi:glycosyltransferase involved in cell wall biosynthesis